MEDAALVAECLNFAERSDIAGLQRALQSGFVPIDAQDHYGRTSLHFAVAHGNIEIVSMLLNMNANASVIDKRGNTPLNLASIGNKPQIVSLLLQSGVNPNQKDALGKTPISWIQDRVRHMRGALYQRRMQYADEDEIIQLREKLLAELQGMIQEMSSWAVGDSTLSQLREVSQKMGETSSLDELDALFSSLVL